MQPQNQEPNGKAENEKRNDIDLNSEEKTGKKEIDESQNDIAGNANANVPEEEQEDAEDESATDEQNDAFSGDFAEPQKED
ncbi:hypothetical protein [Pedobacter namyangjuensis]|uniref:hypothetical protein n=1 Tax=Pedobacter namyangjuensis TaxID=600626 RepID=UPI000DE43DA6|nr:hypothetical protein [Pedobacter namyangjuensis]